MPKPGPNLSELPVFLDSRSERGNVVIRRASRKDTLQIAALMDMASHGIELWYWICNRQPEQSILEFGSQLIQNDEGSLYHFSKVLLLEVEEEVAGGLIAYPAEVDTNVSDNLEVHTEHFPSAYQQLVDLEKHVTSGWYLLAIAVYPEFRGLGLGQALMIYAEGLVRKSGQNRISLIVDSGNGPARHLYESLGFKEVARNNQIAYPGSPPSGDWILYGKDLSEPDTGLASA